jgi:hypothetical protein
MDITAGRMIELKLSGDVVMNGILYGADGQGNMQPQADITGTGKMGLNRAPACLPVLAALRRQPHDHRLQKAAILPASTRTLK